MSELPGPTALLEDRTGRLWAGTRLVGLFCIDGNQTVQVRTSQQTILCLKEDAEGNIWVGTRGGGLKQVRPRVAELLTTGSATQFDGIQSLCKDTQGELWGVVWHTGVILRNAGHGWKPLTADDGWTETAAKCVAADPAGGVWIGTKGNGLFHWKDGAVSRHFCSTNGLTGDTIEALYAPASGELWLGSSPGEGASNGTLFCYKDGAFRGFPLPVGEAYVKAFARDGAGDCWAGTSRGMLLRVRGDVLTDETPLLLADKGCQIRSLLATPDRNLWIGFAGRGLGRLKDGRFTSFRREHGLHDDYVSQILTDGRGRLWLAGNQGISSVRIKDLDERAAGRDNPIQALVYKQKDGLLGLQASFDTSPNAFRDKDGALFFAMQSGVATLYPDAIADDPLPPKVVLDRVLANGKVVALYGAIGEVLPGTNAASLFELGQAGADLHLPSGRRQVEFRFTAPAFTMPESIRFKYQLQGLDKEWIEAGARRSALYSQLAPGHYTFQVIACNRDGVWNEQGASLDVTVPPFWWETAWFRMLAALLLLGSVGGIARYWEYRKMRLKVERAEHKGAVERERARIARDLHDEIGAKLTRLSLLGAMADEDAEEEKWGCSRKAIQEMTGTAREAHRAFDEIVWSVNPRNDTVRSLSHYICKHAGEFFSGTAVTCRCRLPEAMSDQSLLPQHRYQLFLAVKEGLNNILKHACATQVEVAVTLPPGGMCVELADNGRGFDTELADRQGNGLRNMVERMKMAGGSLSLTSRPTQGTRLVFTMPIE